jgi:hypothetical protein
MADRFPSLRGRGQCSPAGCCNPGLPGGRKEPTTKVERLFNVLLFIKNDEYSTISNGQEKRAKWEKIRIRKGKREIIRRREQACK